MNLIGFVISFLQFGHFPLKEKVTNLANVKIINSGNKDAIVVAREKSIPYIAKIDKVGTDGAWWDGVFDFSMRVVDVTNETIVWSANAEYGSGATIRQVEQTNKAMSDMVKDFSKTFPPAK